MDFKTGPLMYGLALLVVAFVIVQSVFFMLKANKRAKEIGMDKSVVKQTIVSSVLFTIAPAISILATVLALASALGIVLPWIRLSVIGNLAYETVAADTALGVLGSSLANEVTDPQAFSTIAWAMTIGASFPLVLLPFLCKAIHKAYLKKVNKPAEATEAAETVEGEAPKKKSKVNLGDVISASAFIGIVAAFISRAIAGVEKGGVSAGFMSISVMLSAMIFTLALDNLCRKKKTITRKIKITNEDISSNIFGIIERKIGLSIFLTFITFGLYGIYWNCLLIKNTHSITQKEKSCVGELLCLTFVPFYSLYWWYTRGAQVKSEISKRNLSVSSNGFLFIILNLFGLSIVAQAIMQNDFNSLPAKSYSEEKGIGFEKLEAFVLPIAMFGAMGIAVLFTQVLPESLVNFTWR